MNKVAIATAKIRRIFSARGCTLQQIGTIGAILSAHRESSPPPLLSMSISARSFCRGVVALLTGVALVVALPHALAQAVRDEGSLAYAPTQAKAGASVDITGRCVRAGSAQGVDVLIAVREQVRDGFRWEQTVAVSGDGSVHGQMTVPLTAPAGTYFVFGSCRAAGTAFYRRTAVFVVLPAVQVKGKTLDAPRESAGSARGLQMLVLAVGLGSVALVGFGEWHRRRVPARARNWVSATYRPMHRSRSGRRSRPLSRR